MELASVKVVLVQGGRVRQNVVRSGDGFLAKRNIEAMYEIDVIALVEAIVQRRFQIPQLVPSHAGYFTLMLLWLKTLYICIEDADALQRINEKCQQVAFTSFAPNHMEQTDWSKITGKNVVILISNRSARSLEDEFEQANTIYE